MREDAREGTTLYLVRHGETEYNRRRIMQGRQINSRLNATGQAQGEALARRLADHAFDAIYTSTLHRAAQTAQLAARYHPETPFHRLKDLEEMSWGVYEGRSVPEVQAVFTEMCAQWADGVFDVRVAGGETILEVQARALRAVDTIVAAHPGGTVLVVTHGRFLRVVLASLLPAYGLTRMQDLHHANTAVNRLAWRDGAFVAELLNSTDHLDQVETIMVE